MVINDTLAAGLSKRFVNYVDQQEGRILSLTHSIRSPKAGSFCKGAMRYLHGLNSQALLYSNIEGKGRKAAVYVGYLARDLEPNTKGLRVYEAVFRPERIYDLYVSDIRISNHFLQRVIQHVGDYDLGKIKEVLNLTVAAAEEKTGSLKEKGQFISGGSLWLKGLGLVHMSFDIDVLERTGLRSYWLTSFIPETKMDPRHFDQQQKVENIGAEYVKKYGDGTRAYFDSNDRQILACG